MICTNCKAGADLLASLPPTALVIGTAETMETVADGLEAKARAFVAEADRLHGDCLGGEQGCGCQHRGTPSERRPDSTPTALITSPAVPA